MGVPLDLTLPKVVPTVSSQLQETAHSGFAQAISNQFSVTYNQRHNTLIKYF